jgi:hypothetical protein
MFRRGKGPVTSALRHHLASLSWANVDGRVAYAGKKNQLVGVGLPLSKLAPPDNRAYRVAAIHLGHPAGTLEQWADMADSLDANEDPTVGRCRSIWLDTS